MTRTSRSCRWAAWAAGLVCLVATMAVSQRAHARAAGIADNTLHGNQVQDDTVDFNKLEDALDLDAATSITGAGANTLAITTDNWSISAAGVFVVGAITITNLTVTGNITANDPGADTFLIGAAADTITMAGDISWVDTQHSMTAAGVLDAVDVANTTIGVGGASTGTFTTFASTGATTLGNNTNTVAIDTTTWDMSSAGVLSNIGSVSTVDNAASWGVNLPVTGVDAGAHTIALSIDGNNGLTVAATGDGAGGVGARTVAVGQSAAADIVGIGDANADVSIADANWSVSAAGGPNFLDGSLPLADLFPGAAANILVTNAGATAWAPVAMSGDATVAATGAVTIALNAVALTADTTGDYVATVAAAAAPSGVLVAGAAGEGTATTLDFDYTATLAGNPALAGGECVFGTTGLICEGASGGANTFEALFVVTDPTADRTYTFLEDSGSVPLVTTAGGGITFTGPTASRAFALPDAAATVLTTNAAVTVGQGGTGLAAGTSGGILGYTAAATLASSVALTASALVLGGGAGATPTPMGSLGTAITLLHGNAAGAPTFSAVVAADITDITRSVNLGLGGFQNVTTPILIDWSSAADASPDFALVNSALTISWDDTGGSIDTEYVGTTFRVPADYASGGSIAVTVTQDAATATIEDIDCEWSIDGGALTVTAATALANQTAVQTVTITPAGVLAAGTAVGVNCAQVDAAADDIVRAHSIEFRYTATQ